MAWDKSISEAALSYAARLFETLQQFDWDPVDRLIQDLQRCRASGAQVFICGNGGSAANAIHWANDLVYPITKNGGGPVRIHALSANQSALTCLANDIGYERIFAYQLNTFAKAGDVVVAMSGSGNSPNIVSLLQSARAMGVKSYAILGYDGGKAKALADVPIHFAVNDMQIAEDIQMLLCHIITQRLNTCPAQP
jgi:D-sedoheptulose 7-phosphate isomerase